MNQFDEYKRLWQLYKDQIEDISAIIANLDSTPEAGDEPFTPDSVIGRIYKIIDRETPESTDEKTCALMAQQMIELRKERDAAIQRT